MLAREDLIRNHPDELKSFINGWFDGTAEAHRNPDRAAKVLIGNESIYADLGEGLTLRVLTTVKLTDLTGNTEMFRLGDSDSKPLFDLIFEQASKTWVKRGYIGAPIPTYQAKDTSLLQKIYEASTGTPAANAFLKPPNEDVTKKQAIMTRHVYVYFKPYSSELDESSKQVLDQEVGTLVQTYSNAYIRIEGNTDSPGSTSTNTALTLARAQAVADYFSERYKMNKNRFIVVGNGADKPIEANTTPEGRTANRRIDIGIVPVN
jgi:NitT/TauT family transport system substrate-binding protein